jgi:hypothetical protein
MSLIYTQLATNTFMPDTDPLNSSGGVKLKHE